MKIYTIEDLNDRESFDDSQPAYEFTKKALEGTSPIDQDGMNESSEDNAEYVSIVREKNIKMCNFHTKQPTHTQTPNKNK